MLPSELVQRLQSLMQRRQLDDTLAALHEALKTHPSEPDLHHWLGWTRAQQGRIEEAITHFREAIRLKPDAVGSMNNLGTLLLDHARTGEAVEILKEAVRQQPGNLTSLTLLSLGLCRVGLFEIALTLLREAVRLDPKCADAHHYLGYALLHLGRLDEADRHLAEAIALVPTAAGYISTLGLLRERQHRLDEATALFQKAVEMNPNSAEPWMNLGSIQAGVWGNYETALHCFEQALRLKPHVADARYHRGMVRLTLGNFKDGWPDYESRPSVLQKSPERYRQPRWQGESLAGQTILLHAEQGLGDTLQFIRYAAVVKDRGGHVICEVQKPLMRLLARTPGIDALIAEGAELPAHDFQIPLLSLPLILGIQPANTPYLFADPERIAFWKERLLAIPGRKIGIAWQGDPGFKYDWLRSIPLQEFAPLARLPNVTLISLQKNQGVEQIAANRSTVPVIELEPPIDTAAGPFMDTAAIMMHLDLVVTCDSALAHLAGGLGVPVWLALSLAPDWRSQRRRDDSPWYPTMRLFRQFKVLDWRDVFERIGDELIKKHQ